MNFFYNVHKIIYQTWYYGGVNVKSERIGKARNILILSEKIKMKSKEEIIVHNGIKYKVIKVLGAERRSKEEIEFEQWSDKKYCLKAVEKNGYALRYVKEQSEAVCLKAVEENGYALQYVKEQKTFLKILKKR